MCCYEGEAFTPNTTITATTTQDGCTTTAIYCRMDGDKAKMEFKVENNCHGHLMENQKDALGGIGKVDTVKGKMDAVEGKVDALEGKVDKVEGKMVAVEGKVDILIKLLEQQISKSGNSIFQLSKITSNSMFYSRSTKLSKCWDN